MLTVACVLRVSREYDIEYVERLKRGVEDNLALPHEFVCLSDTPVLCNRIELGHEWPTWWAKIELFKLPPPVLYFDLDTMIVGDLDEIAAAATRLPFVTLTDFYRGKGVGSGMMAWATDMRWLYELHARDPEGWRKQIGGQGDQGFIEAHTAPAKWQDELPGQVCSYKVHCARPGQERVPKDCRVVCFHGRPKPRDVAWTI